MILFLSAGEMWKSDERDEEGKRLKKQAKLPASDPGAGEERSTEIRPGVPGPCRIVCRSGLLWVTREGNFRDHLLRAGEAFQAESFQGVLAQALEPAEFRLETGETVPEGWTGTCARCMSRTRTGMFCASRKMPRIDSRESDGFLRIIL